MMEASEDYDEDDIEDESTSSPMTDFGKWAGLVSVLRQFVCLSTVVLLPFHVPMYHNLVGLFQPKPEEHYELFFKVTYYMIYFLGFSLTMLIVYIFLSAILVQVIGRKRVVMFCNAAHLAFALFAYFFYYKHNLGVFVVIVFYFLKQCSTMIYYIYIAEIADNTFRLFFFGMFDLTHTAGEVLTQHYLQDGYRLKALLTWGIVVAICTTCISVFIPESPFWLASKGDVEAAERSFSWIRAGGNTASDVAEFDLLLDMAEEREEEGFAKQILSRTFAFCCSFAVLLRICGVHACKLQFVALADFYFPEKYSVDAYDSVDYFFGVWFKDVLVDQQKFLGGFVFLVVGFIFPRKVIFLISFFMGILLVVPILTKPANTATLYPTDSLALARVSLFCHLIAYAGVKPLIYIIPTEIFPASSREFGVAATIGVFHIMSKVESLTDESPPFYFGTFLMLERKTVYFGLALSVVGIPYLMYFMPETMGRTIYDFREINPFPFKDEDSNENTLEEFEEG